MPIQIAIEIDGKEEVVFIRDWKQVESPSRGTTIALDYEVLGSNHFEITEIGSYFRDELFRLIRVKTIDGIPVESVEVADKLVIDPSWDVFRFDSECRALIGNQHITNYLGIHAWNFIKDQSVQFITRNSGYWLLFTDETRRYVIDSDQYCQQLLNLIHSANPN